jgi:hypothetical protein
MCRYAFLVVVGNKGMLVASGFFLNLIFLILANGCRG